MKQKTIEAINQLNKDFYKRLAQEFDTSRLRPWLGMRMGVEKVVLDLGKKPRVLDVGCGNGRFLITLKEFFEEVDYTGVDNNEELLARAKERYPDHKWLVKDVVAEEINGKFDLVGIFGLMHHLPSKDLRKKLLRTWSNCLKPKGKMIISYWRVADKRSLSEKELALRGVRIFEQEKGDYYLGWDKSKEVRYCHSFSLEEIIDLEKNLEIEVVESFEADGKSGRANLYRIYQPKDKNLRE